MYRDPGFAPPTPLRSVGLSFPERHLLFSEKDTTNGQFSIGAATFNSIRTGWNVLGAGGQFQRWGNVRHMWGQTTSALDGHSEWLKMPPFYPAAAAPPDLLELGDCSNDPANTLWPASPLTKLFICFQNANGGY